MQRNTWKLTQLLVIFVLFLTVISMTLCIGDEDNKDDDVEDDNGDDNGNGNGEGNNGDNNTTNDPINFIELNHSPEMPGPDEPVQFMIVLESDNKVEKVDLFICVENICFSPYTKSGTDVETNVIEFMVDQLPGNPKHGDECSFYVKAEDILENTVKSEKVYFEIA